MRIIIETFRRSNGAYLAVASIEGRPVENSMLATGEDESDAAHDALNALLFPPDAPPAQPPTNEEALAYALDFDKEVTFDYTDATGVESHRRVMPAYLTGPSDSRFLTAHDRNRGSVRTFAVGRITNLVVED